MSIDLSDDVVIIDEGHNIEGICRDTGSTDLREDTISEASDDCNECFKVSNNASYLVVVYYLDDIKKLIQEEYLPELV